MTSAFEVTLARMQPPQDPGFCPEASPMFCVEPGSHDQSLSASEAEKVFLVSTFFLKPPGCRKGVPKVLGCQIKITEKVARRFINQHHFNGEDDHNNHEHLLKASYNVPVTSLNFVCFSSHLTAINSTRYLLISLSLFFKRGD